MHQNFKNYLFFPCFLRQKDPCTQWIKNINMANWCLWVNFLIEYSGVVVSCLLPVKIGLHASQFYKLPIFPMFSQDERPIHMVNQKHRSDQLIPVSQDWFSYGIVVVSHTLHVKIGLHTSKFHKLPIFPLSSQEKRSFNMVKQKSRYAQLIPVSQGLILI
jgi:hypothetical protein